MSLKIIVWADGAQSGPLGRIAMGSTSERLAHRCARPLIVVPRAARTAGSPA